MCRLFAVILLISGAILAADPPKANKLTAPEGWSGETIELPPRFAPDMKLKGYEHIRFAPGMMKAGSDTFFSYAFVFELQSEPELTEAVVEEEFLKYYRGLCKLVLDGKLPDLDPTKFTLEMQVVKPGIESTSNEKAGDMSTVYSGALDWIEPFATKKAQKLNLEIQAWATNDRNYLFCCVSPQPRDNAIWKQLHTIRDDYLKRAAK